MLLLEKKIVKVEFFEFSFYYFFWGGLGTTGDGNIYTYICKALFRVKSGERRMRASLEGSSSFQSNTNGLFELTTAWSCNKQLATDLVPSSWQSGLAAHHLPQLNPGTCTPPQLQAPQGRVCDGVVGTQTHMPEARQRRAWQPTIEQIGPSPTVPTQVHTHTVPVFPSFLQHV